MKRIVLTGGGTAGHVTPNMALIPRLQKDGWEVHYIGAANSVEEGLIKNIPGVTYHTVAVGKLRIAVQQGDSATGCFLSGQIAAMVRKEQPAADIVREVMEEAEPILRRAYQWVN